MKSLKFLSGIIIALIILFSCKNPGKTENKIQDSTLNQKKQEPVSNSVFTNDCKTLFDEACKMDSIILGSTELNAGLGNKTIKCFTDFSYYCKDDSLAPVFLIKAGQIAQSINNLPQAQLCFSKCVENYPDFKNRGAAMFLLAQLYDDDHMLNDEEKAKEIYINILNSYPKTEWAKNARSCIDLLGKSDKDIVKEFNKKNKK